MTSGWPLPYIVRVIQAMDAVGLMLPSRSNSDDRALLRHRGLSRELNRTPDGEILSG